MQAAKIPIRQLKLDDIDLSETDIGPQSSLVRVISLSTPKPRPKKIYIPDSSLSASQRMSFLLSGGTTGRRQSNLIRGSPNHLASEIMKYLVEEGMVPR